MGLPYDWHNPGTGGGGGYGGSGGGSSMPTGLFAPSNLGPSSGTIIALLRKRLGAARLPGEPANPRGENPDFNPPSGRGQPQVEYPIPGPPPTGRPGAEAGLTPHQINPYRGIAGFEHYFQPDLNVPGDALSKFFRRRLLAEGYPSRERVQQISDAMGKLQGFNYAPTRTTGSGGLDIGQNSDLLRRLLEQRMGGEGYGG